MVNNCEKCNEELQSGTDTGNNFQNICSRCSENWDRSSQCGECDKTMTITYKNGEEWVNPRPRRWHESTELHKSNCPHAFCSQECERVGIEKQPPYAKDYLGKGKGKFDKDFPPLKLQHTSISSVALDLRSADPGIIGGSVNIQRMSSTFSQVSQESNRRHSDSSSSLFSSDSSIISINTKKKIVKKINKMEQQLVDVVEGQNRMENQFTQIQQLLTQLLSRNDECRRRQVQIQEQQTQTEQPEQPQAQFEQPPK